MVIGEIIEHYLFIYLKDISLVMDELYIYNNLLLSLVTLIPSNEISKMENLEMKNMISNNRRIKKRIVESH